MTERLLNRYCHHLCASRCCVVFSQLWKSFCHLSFRAARNDEVFVRIMNRTLIMQLLRRCSTNHAFKMKCSDDVNYNLNYVRNNIFVVSATSNITFIMIFMYEVYLNLRHKVNLLFHVVLKFKSTVTFEKT